VKNGAPADVQELVKALGVKSTATTGFVAGIVLYW
jgi:hypothetical protein